MNPTGKYCLDAFAWLAWLQDEPGAGIVQTHIAAASRQELECVTSIVNLGEVHYGLIRLGKPDDASKFWRDVTRKKIPVRVIDATRRRVKRAAEWKSRFRIAYADAFAIATAIEFKATLLTGDPEIRPIEGQDGLRVLWLPQRTKR